MALNSARKYTNHHGARLLLYDYKPETNKILLVIITPICNKLLCWADPARPIPFHEVHANVFSTILMMMSPGCRQEITVHLFVVVFVTTLVSDVRDHASPLTVRDPMHSDEICYERSPCLLFPNQSKTRIHRRRPS